MFSNWNPSQPDKGGSGTECCMVIFSSATDVSRRWNYYPNTRACSYIIEYGGMPSDTPIDDITSTDSSTVEIKLDPTGKTITTNV